MKKIFKILLVILLLPFILFGLIYFLIYSAFEMLIVKYTAYFKKNKLKIKEEYYYGILADPVFKIKNIICKYNLEYEVIGVEEDKIHFVVNQKNECKLIIINMSNFYYENEKLYFQENTDEAKVIQVDEYIESMKLDNYSYDTSKLLVKKELVSKEDYDKIELNQSILLVKEVKKDIFDNL